MKKLLVILGMALLSDGLSSCVKPKDPAPTTDTSDYVMDSIITRDKIIGEWTISTVMLVNWRDGVRDIKQEWVDPTGYWLDDVHQLQYPWRSSMRTFVNFQSDGTFTTYFNDNDPNTIDTGGFMAGQLMPASGMWELNGEYAKFTNRYWEYDTAWGAGYYQHSNGITLFGMATAEYYWKDSIWNEDTAWIYFQRIDSTKFF